jgi:hypothetical protein
LSVSVSRSARSNCVAVSRKVCNCDVMLFTA